MSNESEFPPPPSGDLQPPLPGDVPPPGDLQPPPPGDVPPPGNLQPPNPQDLPPPRAGDGVERTVDAVSGFFNRPLGPGVVPVPPRTRLVGAVLEVLLFIITLGIGWMIWSVFAWRNGKTPAKKVMGLTVVDIRTNKPATFGQMALREVVGKMIISSLAGRISSWVGLIGGAMVFGPNRMALWDYIASTTVVER